MVAKCLLFVVLERKSSQIIAKVSHMVRYAYRQYGVSSAGSKINAVEGARLVQRQAHKARSHDLTTLSKFSISFTHK